MLEEYDGRLDGMEYGKLLLPKYTGIYDGDNIESCTRNPKVPDIASCPILDCGNMIAGDIPLFKSYDFYYHEGEEETDTIKLINALSMMNNIGGLSNHSLDGGDFRIQEPETNFGYYTKGSKEYLYLQRSFNDINVELISEIPYFFLAMDKFGIIMENLDLGGPIGPGGPGSGPLRMSLGFEGDELNPIISGGSSNYYIEIVFSEEYEIETVKEGDESLLPKCFKKAEEPCPELINRESNTIQCPALDCNMEQIDIPRKFESSRPVRYSDLAAAYTYNDEDYLFVFELDGERILEYSVYDLSILSLPENDYGGDDSFNFEAAEVYHGEVVMGLWVETNNQVDIPIPTCYKEKYKCAEPLDISIIDIDLTCNLDNFENYTGNDFTYVENEDGGYTIIEYTGSERKWAQIVIPGRINDRPVTQIGHNGDSIGWFLTYSKVTIPCTVEKINENAFYNSEITGVTFEPISNLKIIGEDAFAANSALKQYRLSYLDIPDSVTEIGAGAFYGRGISSLTLGKNIESIGDNAFLVNSLSSVEIPASVKTIGINAFARNNFSEIIFNEGLESIGENAFNGDDYVFRWGGSYTAPLKELILPNSLIHIGDDAFLNNSLETVVFGTNLKTIGARAFTFEYLRDSNKIAGELILPEGLQTIGEEAFKSNKITKIRIPDSVTSLGERAFLRNEINDLTIGKGISTVSESAFAGNLLDDNFIIPNTVRVIEKGGFSDNVIQNLVLPNELLEIGERAFTGNEITTISLPINPLFKVGKGAFNINNVPLVNAFISHEYRNGVPSSTLASYANPSIDFTIPGHITVIGEETFYDTDIESIIIPNTITLIEKGNFSLASNVFDLKQITLPAGITIEMNGNPRLDLYYDTNGKQGGTYKLVNKKWVIIN